MSDEQTLKQQLAEHLKLLGVQGLPAEWFAGNGRTANASEINLAISENFALRDELIEDESVQLIVEGVPQTQTAPPEITSADLPLLRAIANVCTRCRLCEGRTNGVFGVGNEHPQLVFVGEGPGADEDRLGEPFVGRAGELLTAAITKGMGLKREDVYICNVVKCRPPQNRAPLPDETAACTPYLFRQLELLQPKVIVTLGAPAQMALSGVNLGITKLRGKWQSWRGIKLRPTFHPAYILRNPSAKREFWDDLQSVMLELGMGNAANALKADA